MDAVTHSKEEIIRFVDVFLIPVKVDSVKQSELSKVFRVDMTPVYVTTDFKKKEHYRWTGFSPPQDFQQTLRLMKAAFDMDGRQYDSAIQHLSAVVDSSKSPSTPEAMYLLGVAKYKKTGDFQLAVEQWRRLKLSYPNHPLIKKVDYAL
jgi:TolA-binding protein